MKINDFEVGCSLQARLVVADATLGKTKGASPKPYVRLTLTDGDEQITAMLWDYDERQKLPVKGTVLLVGGKCTEYQGKKQLSNVTFRLDDDQSLNAFQPQYVEDPSVYFDVAMELIQGFRSKALKDILGYIYVSHSDDIMDCTSAMGVHHVGIGGNLAHSVEVAKIGLSIAELFPADVNAELVVAGALVHDLGKIDTYAVNGPVIEYSYEGELFDHCILGLDYLAEADVHFNYQYHSVVNLLKHIVICHHGSKEFGAATTPRFIEAYVVAHADSLSATMDTLRQANKKANNEGKAFTDKVFTCNNTRHILQQTVQKVLEPPTEEEPF